MTDGTTRDALPPPVAYKAYLDPVPPANFGSGADNTHCAYTMTLKQLSVELDIRPSGEVTAGTVQNLNVEAVIQPCVYAPAPTVIANYAFQAATATPTGQTVTFLGATNNQTKVNLSMTLTPGTSVYTAVLTFHRTDQGPPLDWNVVVPLTLRPQ